ncbi:MAG: response regulator [Candidatus Hodarchaeales archaeon]
MKRTSRIQTVITPIHRKKLDVLMKKYGTMNEVIERGIELLEQENVIEASPITSKEIEKLRWNSEVFNSLSAFSGFALIKASVIDEFLEVIENKSTLSDFLRKQRQWIIEDNEIQRIVSQLIETLENSYKSMIEVIEQVSDTFRTFRYSIPDSGETKIAIYPNYLQKIPEFVALQLHGILDFLGFTFSWRSSENRIVFEWTDDPSTLDQSVQYIDQVVLKNKQEYLESLLNTNLEQKETIPKELANIAKSLELSNWQQGFFVSGNRRFSYIPQDILIESFDTIVNEKDSVEKFRNIGKMLLNIRTTELDAIKASEETKNDEINIFLKKIAYLSTQILGWGKIEQIEPKKLRISNSIINNDIFKEIINGMLKDYGYQAILESSSEYFNFIELSITESKVKILIVDDDKFWLSTLSKFLDQVQDLETDIITGFNGEEAFEIVKKLPIEVVVCDYNLPGINGTEVLGKIRDINPKIIRIMITGQAEREIAIQAINKAQIHYFIEKPPEPEELQKIIYREVLKSRAINII